MCDEGKLAYVAAATHDRRNCDETREPWHAIGCEERQRRAGAYADERQAVWRYPLVQRANGLPDALEHALEAIRVLFVAERITARRIVKAQHRKATIREMLGE